MQPPDLRFWDWLLRGSGGGAGYKRVANRWLILHIAVGFGLAYAQLDSMKDVARIVLLPFAAVLVGLAFAWAGNAQALLQAEEIREISNFRAGGFIEYVFTYQLSILVLLVTLCVWGVMALGVWDDRWPTRKDFLAYLAIKTVALTLLSVSIRECWHVVLGAQTMLLMRKQVQDARLRRK